MSLSSLSSLSMSLDTSCISLSMSLDTSCMSLSSLSMSLDTSCPSLIAPNNSRIKILKSLYLFRFFIT
jgi:hypothetical protein